MQILVLFAFVVVGLSVNFAWDRTVRRGQARARGLERREARPRALPPAPDDHELERRLPDEGLRRFVALTRASFSELDSLIDQFDLLQLRSEDRAQFGVVTIRSEGPRTEAAAVLARWLEAWVDVDDETRDQLRSYALGPELIAGVLERERTRTSWEFLRDKAEVLAATTTDLDRAIIHMQGIVALLERGRDDPYR